MRRWLGTAVLLLITTLATAATKPHVVALGNPIPVKLFVGPEESTTVQMKVRSLVVDGKVKEFTTGAVHDVTDRTFVVRRAYRINDVLDSDSTSTPRWKWQRGGWLLVDRTSGHVSQLNLPDFDPFYSTASWYRDYVAYCGLSDDGEKLFAVVAQLGRRRALVRKELRAAQGKDVPDSECEAPLWERTPVRVTFAPAGGQKVTFSVRGHADVPIAEAEQ